MMAGNLKLVDPSGSFATLRAPQPSADVQFRVSTTFQIGLPTYLWATTNGSTIASIWAAGNVAAGTFPPQFGFAFDFRNLDRTSSGDVSVSFVSMDLLWSIPGSRFTFTTPSEATLAPDTFPYAAVIGGVVGGLLVVAGVIVIVVLMARRAANAQPVIMLDEPTTRYAAI